MIFLMGAVMLIATYLLIKRVPNLYESRALVIVTHVPSSGEDPLAQGAPIATVMQYLTSRGNLALVARRHKLYPKIKDFDDVIAKLQKEIKLEVKNRGYFPDGPESVTVTFRYADPHVAQKVVADLVSNFEQANVTIRQQATAEVNSLSGKITEVDDRLKELSPQRDLAMIQGAIPTGRSAGEAVALRMQRTTVETNIESLSDKEFSLERQINDLKRQISEQERIVKSASPVNNLAANPAYVGLLGRKADLAAQVKDFSAQYTEKNPKLISARSQLTEIERQIAKLDAASGGGGNDAPTSSPEASELRKMRQDLARSETELEVTRRDLGRKSQTLEKMPVATGQEQSASPLAGVQAMGALTQSRSEYDRVMVRYNWLLTKQDSLMKLAGIAGSGTPMFQVIDAPNAPESPSAPNRMLLYLLALGIAVGVSLLTVLVIELPRMFLLNDERDVEYYLGAPVLALIPETMTPVERSRSRRLRLTRGLIFLLFVGALAPALIVLIDRLQIFQILGSR